MYRNNTNVREAEELDGRILSSVLVGVMSSYGLAREKVDFALHTHKEDVCTQGSSDLSSCQAPNFNAAVLVILSQSHRTKDHRPLIRVITHLADVSFWTKCFHSEPHLLVCKMGSQYPPQWAVLTV